MKKILFLLWCILCISCEPSENNFSSGLGELDGNVYLKNESTPLSGLGVRVSGNKLDFTDSKGYFSLFNLPEGVQQLEVLYDMNTIHTTRVGIQSDRKVTVAIFLNVLTKELPDLSVINIFSQTGWDYLIAGKEECFFMDVENNLPKSAFYHSFKQNKDYLISFNEKGFPTKVITDGYTFLFDNFNGTKVDFAIVSPSGEIQIIREAKSDFNWDTGFTKGSKAEAIKWAGRALGAIPCITSGAAALVTGGAAIPLALWNCGNYFLKITAGFMEDQGVHNGFTEWVGLYSMTSTVYFCTAGITDIVSCLSSFAQGALADWAEEIDKSEKDRSVYSARVTLSLGYGDIQVNLTWNNTSDLDLYVADPFGEEVSFNNPNSTSGGLLDADDMDGYGPENIFWPKLKAPAGIYKVYIRSYPWLGMPPSADYLLLVTVSGKIKKFTGTVNFGEKKLVLTFDKNNF